MLKICKECGELFEPHNASQKFCTRQHYRPCKICGKPFPVSREMLSSKEPKLTCSKQCSSALRKLTCMDKYGGVSPASSSQIQAKMRATTLNRYGVEHAMQNTEVVEKVKSTNLSKYGKAWAQQTDEAKKHLSDQWADPEFRDERLNQIKQGVLAKYGTECVLSIPEIRDKARETYFEKTGYYEPFANPDVIAQSEDTLMERYGVKRPLQSTDIQERFRATCLARYGVENPTQNINVLNRIRQTCLERYDNTCYLQSDMGKQSTHDRMLEKYGTSHYSCSADWKLDRMLDPTKIENLMEFDRDPLHYINKTFPNKPTLLELSESIGTGTEAVSLRLIRHNCKDAVAYVYSYMENSVYNAIKSIDSDIVVVRNTKQIITPMELDIYLPEYKLGIECNPTATHNSSINVFDPSSDAMPYNYHMKKTQRCESEGIFLLHLFGSEWTYSSRILVSMIRNLLGRNSRKVYARNCVVAEINSSDCCKFLNDNHRQGATNSSIRLGLFLGEELVSVMTFGKMRNTIGTDSTDLSDCFELVRFCSLLNTSVVGGADKLFKYFVRNYKPERVRSFSDRAHTRGGLYAKLGFTKIRESDPGYVWVDSRTDISYHRYSAQKHNIKKFLHDDDIDLSKTEKQIMEEHGFLQVFDCGTVLWEWRAT